MDSLVRFRELLLSIFGLITAGHAVGFQVVAIVAVSSHFKMKFSFVFMSGEFIARVDNQVVVAYDAGAHI